MRRHNTPYGEIAPLIGKTPLACRLHYHNLVNKQKHLDMARRAQINVDNHGARGDGGPVVGASNAFTHRFGSNDMSADLRSFQHVGHSQYPAPEAPMSRNQGYRELLPAPAQPRNPSDAYQQPPADNSLTVNTTMDAARLHQDRLDADEQRRVQAAMESASRNFFSSVAQQAGVPLDRLEDHLNTARQSSQSLLASHATTHDRASYGYAPQQMASGPSHARHQSHLPTPPVQYQPQPPRAQPSPNEDALAGAEYVPPAT